MMGLSHDEWQVIALSCKIALSSLTISILPALLMGYVLARKEFFGKSLLETLVFLPLVLPPVVPGYLLLITFGSQGVLGQYLAKIGMTLAFDWKGAVLASSVMGFPLMVQSVRLAIELVDRRLEIAGMTLGASRLQVFFGITLPLAKTGILVGAMLAFCRSLGEFGATITFVGNIAGQTRTLPLAIYSLLQQPNGDEKILRLMLISIAVAFVAMWLAQWYNRIQKTRLGR
ncbi:molybdate ABC transporter permease subunit [Moraxella sp. FZLJ2107]|uniref:molybdate ABC transporter permease subunit n=1 Tax=unclassified Moraxella TaxID=2685852 RepID=UPI0020C8E4A2|nr:MULTISPECIES: molybdate ABC transporter permease subunit [unclassified Moraxella]UTO05475.1 molybdate ABC transporter permease subunit [Moraxella sp. FZLJ2107]UTO22211.1 molybdate ABC transporter permease subunit [Moraxella sp. FZLJ2109]